MSPSDTEARRRGTSADRSKRRSRSRSPRQSYKHDRGDGHRDRERNRDRDRARRESRSPARRPRSRSRSRTRSPAARHRPRSPPPRSPRRRSDRASRSRSRERRKRPQSRSRSSSSSSSSDEDGKRHRKRKEKHRKRSRSRERKEKRKSKKDKKEKKSKKGSSTAQWGYYGIINESDLYTKEAEFRTWLVEERKINPETITKDATKKEFARFVEDFNTATLPHEKYYNIDKYERQMNLMRNGETLPPTDDKYDPNADLAAHSSRHKRAAREHDSYMSKEQLQELRRVQHERIQVGKMKAMGLEVKQSMGVRMDGNAFDD